VLAIRKIQIFFAQKLYTCTVRKGYSPRNYQLLDKESTRRIEFCRKLPAHGRGIHRKNGIPPGITDSWSWVQTGKIKNLPIGNNSRNRNS
jgi:hypothetical protein